MIAVNNVERKLRELINRDLEVSFEKERLRDPLIPSVYLFFLLRNKVESDAIDNLIDWMNCWINEILNKKNFGKFVDREFTSALFGYYSLSTADRLSTEVDLEDVKKMSFNFIVNDLFFNNLMYSLMILLPFAEQINREDRINRVFQQVKRNLKKGVLFNDAKNIVFLSLFFEKMELYSEIKTIVNTCIEKVRLNEVPFGDRVYYAWILWMYRKLVEGREWSNIVAEFTKNTLENFSTLLDEVVIDEEIIEVYGPDVKRMGVSRILLAVALDLAINFNKSRISAQIPAWSFIERKLRELNWSNVLRELNLAISAFEENRMSDCCNNLRMALITLLAKIYELLEGCPPPIEPGKTPNPRSLLKPMQKLGLDDQSSRLILGIWSYVSERAHIEKRGGQPPSRHEVKYGLQLVFSSIECLLNFLTELRNKS
ncbi:hypothetical protein J7L00_01095 [Candidatus Bathyarchaeota archaeon]|nr:hypothetical protein [Candidatus Bathyarchaeota archaeon]